MRHLRTLAICLLATALAACGGPPTPPTPPAPNASGFSPSAAPRGDSIVVSGTDFTGSGSLTIGGVAAIVSSWTDTQITAAVAPGTPEAWQEVVVTNANGTDSLANFFVGVEFGGTAAGLQGFLDGLDTGTAVLLGAQEYDLSGEPTGLIVDNHSLYGRGTAQTQIELSPSGAIVLVEFNAALTVADLSIEGDSLFFFHGSVPAISASGSMETFLAGNSLARSSLGDLQSTRSFAELKAEGGFAELAAQALTPAAVALPHLTLRNVEYREVVGGGTFGAAPVALAKLDVELIDVSLALDNSALTLVTGGDIRFDAVEFTTLQAQIISIGGAVEVLASSFEAGMMALGADSGLNIDGSELRTVDGELVLIGAVLDLLAGVGIPTGGPISVTGSVLEALDGDFADGSDTGTLLVITQLAPIEMRANSLMRAHLGIDISTVASEIGEADIVFQDNLEVRVGVFKADDSVNFRSGTLQLVTAGGSMPDQISLVGNTIFTSGDLTAVAGGGNDGNLRVIGNTIAAGDGEDNGAVALVSPNQGTLVMDDNNITVDDQLVVVAGDLADTPATISGNVINAIGDNGPVALFVLTGGSCLFEGNSMTGEDISEDHAAGIVVVCSLGDPLTQEFLIDDNELVAAGAGSSSIQLALPGGGNMSLTSNQLQLENEFQLNAVDTTLTVSDNQIVLHDQAFLVVGNSAGELTLTGNTVTQVDGMGAGLRLYNVGSATVTGNSFSETGIPGPNATALAIEVDSNLSIVVAAGNTFTNYSRALYFDDLPIAALGIEAVVTGNLFDFTIDAAPEVAELVNVKDQIDARYNVWGGNTSLVTLQGYVTLGGDTVGQGGGILLDPIALP